MITITRAKSNREKLEEVLPQFLSQNKALKNEMINQIITKEVEKMLNSKDALSLSSILRDGWTGYTNASNEKIVEEYLYYHLNPNTDRDLEGLTVLFEMLKQWCKVENPIQKFELKTK